MSFLTRIFSCTRCGYCCQGDTTVSLDSDDQKRMVAALGMSKERAAQDYWRVTGNVVQMKTVDGHCIFYKDGCTVHEGRPWRCAQWPLHPSILTDQNNFRTIADSCPGINKQIPYEEFCDILQELMKNGIISC